MKNLNKVLFMGGYTGIVKKETSKNLGKPFYILNFAVANEQNDHFGFDVCSIAVEDSTYKEFYTKVKPNSFISAIVKYSHGYWDLSYYEI